MEFSESEDEFSGTPPEIKDSANSVISNLLPEKSKRQYEKTYGQFKDWCEMKKAKKNSENVLLAYLEEKSKKVKSATLWSTYSMLKATLNVKENVDIRKFNKLILFLKKKSVGYQAKKSQVLTRDQVDKFMTGADDENYLMMKIRYRFGCYDEIITSNDRKIRHCNWIRFLQISDIYGPQVNLVCTKVKGEPIYEVVKPIPPNQELIVYYLPERPEELFFVRMRNTLYRQTMDSVLEDSPLDLSMSLLSRVLLPISPPSGTEDEHKSISEESSIASSNGDCLESSISLRRSSPKSRPVRGERALLPCEVCGKAFDRPSLLKRHMRTHTGEKPHVCMVCSKGFSTSSSLNTHRRIHSGEKPHQCQVCGKRFTASSNLYYHRMTHIKEKPHKCSLCSKSFPTPGDLKSHMYVHSGSWPFKCHICSRGFSKHTNLKNHLFLHTGDKPHACELCNKKFALACNLRAHMKTHEGDPQEECVRCGKVYLISSNEINQGFCAKCLLKSQDHQGNMFKSSSGESGSEEDSSNGAVE